MGNNPRNRLLAVFSAINLLLVLHAALVQAHSHQLKVTFLDVGQGDAAVIEAPNGRVVLVDTGGIAPDGGRDRGHSTVEPFLRHEGISHVDAIVLTHPHADHIGGADAIINDLSTDMVLDNGEPTVPRLEQRVFADAADHHTARAALRRGQTLDLGDGITLQALGPTDAEAQADMPNNASVILRLGYGKRSFLFMGDAELEEEQDLLTAGINLRCTVLKAGHHGSKTSSSQELLEQAHPEAAIVSVGAHNGYGHPSPEVIDRLKAMGVKTYRTDLNGAITCTTDGDDFHISTMR